VLQCGVQFRRHDQAAHDAVCAMRSAPCSHGCDALMPPAALLSALAHGGADAEHAIAALAVNMRNDGMCSRTAAAMCNALLQTMEASISHLGVQREAFILLQELALDETRSSLAATALVAALAAHPEVEDLHKEACVALGNLATHNVFAFGAANADACSLAVAAAGGLHAAINAMRAFAASAAMQTVACRAFRKMLRPDANKTAAAAAGCITAVLSAMQTHGNDPDLHVEACEVLCCLTELPENDVLLAADAGAVPTLLATLQVHLMREDVQKSACAALHNVTLTNIRNRELAWNLGAIATVLTTMRAHCLVEGVQELACAALCNLKLLGEDAEIQSKAGIAGAIETVLSAARAHGTSLPVHVHACMLLAYLTYHHEDNQAKVGRLGGIEVVLAAMRAHSANVELQLEAWSALFNITMCDANVRTAITGGGIEAALSAMQNHPEDDAVHDMAGTTLHNMCLVHADAKDRARDAGAVEVLNAAVARFPALSGAAEAAEAALTVITAA
jgi:hypothetical protein